jgi:hypothetical protein
MRLNQEGRQAEAKDRVAQYNKVRDMILTLSSQLQKQQQQRLAAQAQAQNNNATTMLTRASMEMTTRAQQPAATMPNVAVVNPTASSNPNNTHMSIQNNMNANPGGGMGTNPMNNAGVGHPGQSDRSQQGGFSWRGIMCIVTGNDGTRVNTDILIGLTPMKASMLE